MKLSEVAQVARGDNWVIPRYEQYMKNRDTKKEALLARGVIDQPERIREGSWSASSQGTCPRRQQFTFLGMPRRKNDDSNNILFNGEYVHLRHQVAGLAAGYIRDVEVPVFHSEYLLRGTMDGVLSNGLGLEIKSINMNGFGEVLSFGPKTEHLAQVNAYMMATGIEAFRILYENKNTNALKEFLVKGDPDVQGYIKRTIEKLNESTKTHELAPMLSSCRAKTGFAYRYCQYSHICEGAEWPTSKSLKLSQPTPDTSSSGQD